MKKKTEKRFLFESFLQWKGGNSGKLTGGRSLPAIDTGTAPQFGGDENCWNPELLLLGAVSGSFMETFLAFAKKMACSISTFQCNCIGLAGLNEGKYHFARIDLYPGITVENEIIKKQVMQAVKKTHANCLVAQSLNAEIFYHTEITISNSVEKKSAARPNNSPKLIKTRK